MVFSNVTVDMTIPCRSFVFSQLCAKVSAVCPNVSGLAVARMTTSRVVKTSVTLNNSPVQEHPHLDNHASPTYKVVNLINKFSEKCNLAIKIEKKQCLTYLKQDNATDDKKTSDLFPYLHLWLNCTRKFSLSNYIDYIRPHLSLNLSGSVMTESAKTGPLRFGSENQLNFAHKYIVIQKL